MPAGHCLTWENGRVEQRLWYHFIKNIQAADDFVSEVETRKEWLVLARESIRLRFRADVPVGFNLSGGLDSSLLLGLVQDQFGDKPGIQSYTFFTGDPRYDELEWAREMVAHTEFPHWAVPLSQAEVPALAAAIAACEDEPYIIRKTKCAQIFAVLVYIFGPKMQILRHFKSHLKRLRIA